MTRLLLFVFLLLIAGSARAQPIEIRTGEHANFTRVVLFVPSDTDWSFEQTETGYILDLPVENGYDLRGFYDLIPRTRIARVAQRAAQGELVFDVNCDCTAQPYIFRAGILVIDFTDRPFEGTVSPVASPEQRQPEVGLITARTAVASNGDVEDFVFPLFFDAPTALDIEVQENTREAPIVSPSLPDESTDLVDSFSSEVTQALGVGLSQGLLLPRPTDTASEEVARDFERATQLSDEALPGVAARTSIAVPTSTTLTTPDVTQSGRTCLPESYFALQDWGDDRAFHLQIGAARADAFDDRDRPSEPAIVRLAQAFLYFGFGEEAIQALQLQEFQSQERRYLIAVANILEGRAPAAADFEGQVSCASSVSLWALLAQGQSALDARVERDTVLTTFKALPSGVRDVVAPQLAQAFVRLGDRDASRQVLSRLAPNDTAVPEAVLAATSFAFIEEGAETALETILPALNDSTRVSPELVAEYFELGVEAGHAFTDTEFTLSDALRFEFAGTPEADVLAIAQFRAQIAMSDFGAAYQLMTRFKGDLDETTFTTLESEFVIAAVENMADAAFGRYAWNDDQLPNSTELRSLIAERLLNMGFAERAAGLMGLKAEIDMPTEALTPVDGPPIAAADDGAQASATSANGNDLRAARELIQSLSERRSRLSESLDALTIPASP